MIEIKGAVVNGVIAVAKKRNGVQVCNNIISQLDEQVRQLFENRSAGRNCQIICGLTKL